MYIFSDSSIYDNGHDSPTGVYTYANIHELFALDDSIGSLSYGYFTTNTLFTINANTLEVEFDEINNESYSYYDNIPVTPKSGVTCTGSITKRRDKKINHVIDFSENTYVFNLTFTINTPQINSIIATFASYDEDANENVDGTILGRIYRNSGQTTIPVVIYVDSKYKEGPNALRTDTTLEAGDIIKINHSMTTLCGENKMD